MAPTSDPRADARGPITPAQLQAVAVATMDPLALYRVEGPGRYRHEWLDDRALRPGFPPEDQVIGRCFHEVFAPEIAERFHEAADQAVATGRTVRYLGSTQLDTFLMDIEVTVAPHFAGDTVQLITSIRDIRDRMALEREREASNRRVRKLMEHAPDMVWLVDERGTILDATGGLEALLGYRIDEVIGRPSFTLVHDEGMAHARSYRPHVAAATSDRPVRFELQLRHRDGSTRWVECRLTNLLDDPDIGAIVVNSHDITERKLVEQRLAHDALHDSLTGLPNRVLVSQRIEAMLDLATGDEQRAAVFYVDFDGFKLINDTFGHDLGDTMIRAAAARLESTVGDRGWAARLGGDEFIVVTSEVAGTERHMALAHEIRSAFMEAFELNGSPIYLTACMGVASAQAEDGLDADEMLRRADMAMYEAKRRGHNSVQLFDSSLRQRTAQRLEMRIGLRRAYDEQQLRLEYQPIFSNATRTVTGVEALIRWDHPTRGVIMPGDFIHTAEETGLIIPIGDWVLDQVCQQLATWERNGFARVQVAANVSPKQLLEPDFVDKVRASIARANIDPSSLVIEITENLIMEDPKSSRTVLQQLAAIGIGCAIDDFGMGYSSLSYLANLPATVLKIDRTFVAPLGEQGRDDHDALDHNTALVGAIIGMAHALGLAVVAEGVESERQLIELRRLGCEYAQGFHLARPMSPGAVEQFLRLRSPGSARASSRIAG
jgi:diguanylate cyclase (GGDEF)-like protein/PAS domain S-box-containing protein